MITRLACVVLAIGCLGASIPGRTPLPIPLVVNGTHVIPYAPGQTNTIVCGPRYACSIAFASDEQIQDIVCPASTKAMADGWIVQQGTQGSRPMIYLLPKAGAPITNLIVTTTRRLYQMELVAQEHTALSHTAYAFLYPEEALVGPPATPSPPPVDYAFSVKIESGKPPFAAIAVRRVGDLTYIALPPGTYALPDVIAQDGTTTSPVAHSYEVESRTIVVQGIYPTLLLYTGTGKDKAAVSIARLAS